MIKTLMINCFVYTKQCQAYLINQKNDMDLIFLEDCEASTIVETARTKGTTNITLWGPAAFCKGLQKEILAIDDSLKIECK